jgi:rare lipoprotein A
VKVEYVGRAPLAGSDDRKLAETLREDLPGMRPEVQVASNKPYVPAYFDNRPLTQVPAPPDRPYRLGEGAREVPAASAAPRTMELASVSRPQSAPPFAQAQEPVAEPEVSQVSAYAPVRNDGHAGILSGRGLY